MALDLSKGNQAGIFWYDGDADVSLCWAIRDLIPLGGVFIDCGANCGLMGLLASQYRRAQVVFIEPHPRLAASIQTNIRLNHFESRAELIEAAASNTSGHATFYESPAGDDGTHSLHADWKGEKRVLGKVRCETLKEIIERKQIAHLNFLKIDTEGNDFAVLQGMAEYLRPSFAELIYVEMTSHGESICKLMDSCGYAGFYTAAKRGRDLARLLRTYEKGGRVCFFRPLESGPLSGANVLWCGKDSIVAGYLKDLGQ